MGKSAAKSVADAAEEQAGKVADAATDRARREAETARDMAAEETQRAADAAQAAADQFDPGSVQAQAIEQVARRIDEVADQLRATDIDKMARMVGDAARRNPMMFVAGAALAGFAVTRFLKARDPRRTTDYGRSEPWNYPTAGSGTDARDRNLTSRGAV